MAAPQATFALLGPFELRLDGQPIEIRAARVRALVTVLLLHAGEVVSGDRLIDELWGADPPASAAHALQVYVSDGRKALGPARELLETRSPGYLMRVRPDQLDLLQFEAAVAAARRALSEGDAQAAADRFDDALSLWRGEPLADFAYEPFAQVAIGRLDELRASAEEERISAELALGRHRELVPRVQELVGRHPLREGLREQFILALYRSGRQAEALQAYQDARAALLDELGIEPSRSLQELERLVLNQDPSLEHESDSSAAPRREDLPRSILIVGIDAANEQLEDFALHLAGSAVPHGLIAAVLVDPATGDPVARLKEVNRSLAIRRRQWTDDGIAARATAFTSASPADDILRLAAQQDVDLVLLEWRAMLDAGGRVTSPEILENCAADVAIAWPRDLRADGAVVIPFAGSADDWAALELAAWLATALDVELRLLGAESDGGSRDASRLLGSAALAVQQLSNVSTEIVLVARGPEAVVAASQEASAVIVSLPERWQSDGIGPSRLAIGERADAPVVLVRRGLRPGGLAPPAQLTRFTWSMSGH